MKKAPRETQTPGGLQKGGAQNFRPPQIPSLGARDGQNLISWRWSLPLPTNPVWYDQCTQFRVIVETLCTHWIYLIQRARIAHWYAHEKR